MTRLSYHPKRAARYYGAFWDGFHLRRSMPSKRLYARAWLEGKALAEGLPKSPVRFDPDSPSKVRFR